MIALSIEATLEIYCFEQVVSTEDEEIVDVVRSYGAEVPFIRPAELSTDQVPTIDVTKHAINWCFENNINVSMICCIYATSPLIKSNNIYSAWLKLKERVDKDYAFPVCSYPHPIQRALRIKGSQWENISMFFPDDELKRSQDLEVAYHDAAQFYWGRAKAFLSDERVLSSPRSIPIIVPRLEVIDIDEPEDWYMAEKIFFAVKGSG